MKFGTSGLRGLVAVTDHVAAFLAYLATLGAAPRKVLVGCDLGPSSPAIAAACGAAIRNSGADAGTRAGGRRAARAGGDGDG